MSSKIKAALLFATLLVALTGCTAGPSYLTRTVDDWQNNMYADNPLVASVVSDVVPGFLILKVLAAIPDYLFLNPTQFWLVDIWRAKGAAHKHDNPQTIREPWFAGEFD